METKDFKLYFGFALNLSTPTLFHIFAKKNSLITNSDYRHFIFMYILDFILTVSLFHSSIFYHYL